MEEEGRKRGRYGRTADLRRELDEEGLRYQISHTETVNVAGSVELNRRSSVM